MLLKRTPAEKMLLARICEQAIRNNDTCADSNKELAEAVGMHQQTVSDLINRLDEANLLQISVETRQANKRQIMPSKELLVDYKSIAYSADSDHKSFTDTAQSDYKSIAYTPIRHCPITGIDITHQGINYPVVTAATIKRLFKRDPQQFHEVTVRLGLPVQIDESMVRQCLSLTHKVQEIVNTYPPGYFKGLLAKEASDVPLRPRRFCPVTGIDISHQRPNCRFVTSLTLTRLLRNNKHAFDQLVARFLHPCFANYSAAAKSFQLAATVRKLSKEHH